MSLVKSHSRFRSQVKETGQGKGHMFRKIQDKSADWSYGLDCDYVAGDTIGKHCNLFLLMADG